MLEPDSTQSSCPSPVLYLHEVRGTFLSLMLFLGSAGHVDPADALRMCTVPHPKSLLREAFKKYLQKTYGIFHMLVDKNAENGFEFILVKCRKHMEKDPSPPPNIWKNPYVF